jgi:hypothetical protein
MLLSGRLDTELNSFLDMCIIIWLFACNSDTDMYPCIISVQLGGCYIPKSLNPLLSFCPCCLCSADVHLSFWASKCYSALLHYV